MTEVIAEGVLPNDITKEGEEAVTKFLTNDIIIVMGNKIRENIDDIVDVDMSYNPVMHEYEYKMSFVLCSEQDVITTSQIMARRMADFGLNDDQIEEVINIQIDSFGGF